MHHLEDGLVMISSVESDAAGCAIHWQGRHRKISWFAIIIMITPCLPILILPSLSTVTPGDFPTLLNRVAQHLTEMLHIKTMAIKLLFDEGRCELR